MNSIDKLLNAALLGCERQPFSMPESTDADVGAPLLARLDPSGEGSLLRAAAISTTCTRAGRLPQSFEGTLPAAAEHEVLPQVSPEAVFTLDRLLKGQYPEFLPLWLSLAGKAGRHVPGKYLPMLLDVAAGSRMMRSPIMAVMGMRGAWLASHNPRWKSMAGVGEDWNSENHEVRLEYFRELRASDPASARELLQGSWKEVAGSKRAELVYVLIENASMEDQDFLENLLDEKRGEVRQAAAWVLAGIPESAFVQRMIARIAPAVSVKKALLRKTQLQIELPSKPDDTMERDGFSTKQTRAQTLTHIIRSIPLVYWENELDLNAEDFIAAGMPTDFAKDILLGIREAIVRQRNEIWASALVENIPAARLIEIDLLNTVIAVTTPSRQEKLAGFLVQKNFCDPLHIVQNMPWPWGVEFSRVMIKERMQKLASQTDMNYRATETLKVLARGLAAEVAEQALALAEKARTIRAVEKKWDKFIAAYKFRIQLERELIQ